MDTSRLRIGELLVRKGQLDRLQLESALAHQRRFGGRLGRAIIHLGFMSQTAFLEALAEQLGTPYLSVAQRHIDPRVIALVPTKLIRAHKVLPLLLLREGRRGPLVCAVADPVNVAILDEVRFACGYDIRPVLASEEDLDVAIARHLGGGNAPRMAQSRQAIDLPEISDGWTLLGSDGRPTRLN